MQLHSKRLFRLTMEIEKEPIHYVDKEKYWNRLDEAYRFLNLVKISFSVSKLDG